MTHKARKSRKLNSSEKEGVVEALVQGLILRAEIVFALLHGSFIDSDSFRDLDLAVYVTLESIRYPSICAYENELSVRLTESTRIPVDVRVLNDSPPSFRYHALKGRVLVVRNAEVLDEFRARTWDDYFDFAPFARQYLREVLGE